MDNTDKSSVSVEENISKEFFNKNKRNIDFPDSEFLDSQAENSFELNSGDEEEYSNTHTIKKLGERNSDNEEFLNTRTRNPSDSSDESESELSDSDSSFDKKMEISLDERIKQIRIMSVKFDLAFIIFLTIFATTISNFMLVKLFKLTI